ncbi:MAG: hypothetical protein HY736_15535 [Verrucomicrobia bacterium]|nr:hypothetical protein [Verrucomicrobiota bacterium]
MNTSITFPPPSPVLKLARRRAAAQPRNDDVRRPPVDIASEANPSGGADAATLQKAWQHIHRSRELLDAEEASMRAERVLLQERETAVKRREDAIAARERQMAEHEARAAEPAPEHAGVISAVSQLFRRGKSE